MQEFSNLCLCTRVDSHRVINVNQTAVSMNRPLGPNLCNNEECLYFILNFRRNDLLQPTQEIFHVYYVYPSANRITITVRQHRNTTLKQLTTVYLFRTIWETDNTCISIHEFDYAHVLSFSSCNIDC